MQKSRVPTTSAITTVLRRGEGCRTTLGARRHVDRSEAPHSASTTRHSASTMSRTATMTRLGLAGVEEALGPVVKVCDRSVEKTRSWRSPMTLSAQVARAMTATALRMASPGRRTGDLGPTSARQERGRARRGAPGRGAVRAASGRWRSRRRTTTPSGRGPTAAPLVWPARPTAERKPTGQFL